MAKKDVPPLILSEHVLEVRHPASGSFLDVRGYVADYIRSSGLLPHWRIETNVVNYFDEPGGIGKEGGFAGFKSAGYMTYNPDTRNYFVDRAGSFWKTLQENGHYKLPEPERFGTRIKVFIPSEKSFEELNDTIFQTFYSPTVSELLGGKEHDVQFILDFTEDQFEAKLSGGPIRENEVGRYLKFQAEEFENRGVYLDLDYFKTKDISNKSIGGLLKKANTMAWNKIDKIAGALGI